MGENHAYTVAATKSGTVVAVYSVNDKQHWGYGNGLIIKHTDGSGYSMYAHMDSVSVGLNQKVTRGQFLGYMGNTGNSGGKHLHFELCSNVKMQGSYFNGQPYSIDSNPGTLQYSYTLCEHTPVFKSDYKVVCSTCNETLSLPTLTSAPGYLQIVLPKGKSDAPSHVTPYGDATVKTRYEKGETVFVRGYLENTFSPNLDCTSAQVLTFLWAANGRPAAATTDTAWYGKAVAWANNSGLTGNMGTAFSPANPSPRSEIVTYLYRNAGSPGIAAGK